MEVSKGLQKALRWLEWLWEWISESVNALQATLYLSLQLCSREKHLNGHQNGSDTNLEGSKK